MSQIIHTVLFEKLRGHPEWRKFRETFWELTGRRVELVDTARTVRGKGLRTGIDVRGVHIGTLEVQEAEAGPDPGPGMRAAWTHLLSMAAERFAALLSESHIHDHERLPAVVLKTCGWIRSRALTHDIRLVEAAELCGLSASHLSRLFHRSTGMTFQAYVTRFRLERACELLVTTTEPVTTIAFESGFQSVSQFHRSFKAVYGERPRDYRKRRARALP